MSLKKTLSLLLAICMALTLLPAAHADESAEPHTVTFLGNGHGEDTIMVLNVPDGQSIADIMAILGDEDGWGVIYCEVIEDGKRYFADAYAWDPEGTELLTDEDWSAPVYTDLIVYARWLDKCIEEVVLTVTPPVAGTYVDTPMTEGGYRDIYAQEKKPVVTVPDGVPYFNYAAFYCGIETYEQDGEVRQRIIYTVDTTMVAGESYDLFMVPQAENDAFFSTDVKVTVISAQLGEVYYMNSHCLNVTASVTAAEYMPGDVDRNGVVNTTDVILIRRFIAGGYNVEINKKAADVDANGQVNTTDVILIRRFIAGGYGVVLKPGKEPNPGGDIILPSVP